MTPEPVRERVPHGSSANKLELSKVDCSLSVGEEIVVKRMKKERTMLVGRS